MRYLTAAGYQELCPDGELPRTDDDSVDVGAIERGLDAASATCRSYLPDLLIDDAGAPIAAPDEGLADSLAGIVYRIARYRLSDSVTGDKEHMAMQHKAAIAELQMLKRDPAPPDGPEAEIVAGVSRWAPAP